MLSSAHLLSGKPVLPLILVVDDESIIREVLAALLTDDGFRVACASDGQKALEHVAIEQPDLIISDVRMPNMDGLTLLTRLRERGVRVPVILISAHYAGTDAPGIHFIPKPFDIDHLRKTVVGCLDSANT